MIPLNRSDSFSGDEVRRLIHHMIRESGGGHAGGSLSFADVIAHLYSNVLRFDPIKPDWNKRDRFILSKGHSSLALYAVLALCGFFDVKELSGFAQEDSVFMNHPDAHRIPGVEISTGSLGHGFPMAVRLAITGKITGTAWRVYSIVGDGEIQEGSVWEAAMYAAHHQLSSLTLIVDRNRIGNDGPIDNISSVRPLKEKWIAFGWDVFEINGHAEKEIAEVLPVYPDKATVNGKPRCIIANTVKGHGLVEGIAGTGKSHYISGSPDEISSLFTEERKELGCNVWNLIMEIR